LPDDNHLSRINVAIDLKRSNFSNPALSKISKKVPGTLILHSSKDLAVSPSIFSPLIEAKLGFHNFVKKTLGLPSLIFQLGTSLLAPLPTIAGDRGYLLPFSMAEAKVVLGLSSAKRLAKAIRRRRVLHGDCL